MNPTHFPLTYVELFAGAGGLSYGLENAGWKAIAHAEIDIQARDILRRHWPGVRLDYDVTQINGTDYRGVTLISGGSPCQDLSIAGHGAGMRGARSSLFFEQARIWKESEAPLLLWENVTGALNSNWGEDFAIVLSTLVGAQVIVPSEGWKLGGLAIGPEALAAWRVLDLQYFGPPQRRQRVFIVASRTGGIDPGEVLALGEGMCTHPEPFRIRETKSTGGNAKSTPVVGIDIAPTLGARDYKGPGSFINGSIQGTVLQDGRLRRLTPLECERLMGWPDNWTAIGLRHDGTEYTLSDTARYKLIGNGCGSPQVRWIASRLAWTINN
jgi:DNA (cytosine-5)-methyltransferase 1